MRIVTLTVNTLHLSKGMVIKGCHFFDLIENHSIPLLEANTSEYITKDSE